MGISNATLTKKDKKILQVASQMGNMGMNRLTVEQIAKEAGTRADFIYERLSDAEFKRLFFETLRSSLAIETPAILKKFVEEAKKGSFKHGKLILEISGLYSEETNINLRGKLDVTESPFESDMDRAEFLKDTLGRHGLKGD